MTPSAAPAVLDIGETFLYQGHAYRVEGWLCTAPAPSSEEGDLLAGILYQGQRPAGPDCRRLQFCRRAEAEYLAGTRGMGTCIARAGDVQVIERTASDEWVAAKRATAECLAGQPLV